MGITWNQKSIDDARAEAYRLVGSYNYHPVQVTVAAEDDATKTVTLDIPTANGGTIQLMLAWGDIHIMWAACPSTLIATAQPHNAGKTPPQKTQGDLYLREDFIHKHGIQTDLSASINLIKWPRAN